MKVIFQIEVKTKL